MVATVMASAARFLRSVRFPLREIVRAGHATSLRLATTAFTLVFGIAGARLLGDETFGAYVSLFTIAGLLTVATSFSLPALLQREVAASRGNGDRSLLKPIVQGLAITNIVLVFALVTASLFGASQIVFILMFCLAGNAASILAALFVAHERVLLASWITNVFRPLVALLALIALALTTAPTALLPLYAQITGTAAAAIVLLMLWRGEPLSRSKQALVRNWWSDQHMSIIRAGLLFTSTQVLINLTTQIDILILTLLAEPEDVAHYYAAVRAAMVISFFFGTSGMVVEPTLTRLFASGNSKEVQALATRTATSGCIITFIAAICAIAIAPYYFELYGPEFINAYPSFCVFSLGLIVLSLFGPAQPLLRVTRSDNALLMLTVIAVLINAILTAALIPVLGMLGAAIGSGVQFAIYGALLARALWQRSSLRSDVFVFASSIYSNDRADSGARSSDEGTGQWKP